MADDATPPVIEITLLFEGRPFPLECDPLESVELLRHQIWSATGVPLAEQAVQGMGALNDTTNDLPISSLGLLQGTWGLLARQSPAQRLQGHADNVTKQTSAMEARLASGFATAREHIDELQLAAAREVIPWERLCAEALERADAALKESGTTEAPPAASATIPEAPGEWELRALLRWFKHEFFSWVDKPPCEVTGEGTELVGMGVPTAEERKGGAGRVELYSGPSGHVTRFARFNKPSVLLRTRRGRCGEWANCFTLCCRAVGFQARWVLDVTDHVWTEVWLPQWERWVHADSCECALDAPLLYERGWGKKLSYVFAFEANEATDVAPRYSGDWEACLTRRDWVKEGWLEIILASMNAAAQSNLSSESRAAMERRAIKEREQLALRTTPEADGLAAGGTTPLAGSDEDKEAEKRVRQTGSIEWREARGEMGHQHDGIIEEAPGEASHEQRPDRLEER